MGSIEEVMSSLKKEFDSIKSFATKHKTGSIIAIVALVYYLWLRKK